MNKNVELIGKIKHRDTKTQGANLQISKNPVSLCLCVPAILYFHFISVFSATLPIAVRHIRSVTT